MRVATEQAEANVNFVNVSETRRLRVIVADGSLQYMKVVLALVEFHESVDVIGRATNFEETVQLVGNHQPDLVLIDLDMPLANLAIPAIILSASCPMKIVAMCSEETVRTQPLDILTTVNALIHKSRLREEFLPVLDALYGGPAALNAILPPADFNEDLPRSWFGLYSQTTH